ncbi:MAG: TPR repeat protein [Candidatus Azotimanducaceae bacterium]|jgi:TPR repeat protein
MGNGVPEDHTESVKWLRLAAEQRQATVKSTLGLTYAKVKGAPENDRESYLWWSLANTEGDERAKQNIEIIKKIMITRQLVEAQKLAE